MFGSDNGYFAKNNIDNSEKYLVFFSDSKLMSRSLCKSTISVASETFGT